MSTLTKILVVLLSLFSIFLCGAVVTYVSVSNNYKMLFEEQRDVSGSLEADKAAAEQLSKEKSLQMAELEDDLRSRIQLLEDEKSRLQFDLRAAERKRDEYEGLANSGTTTVSDFRQTIDNLQQSLRLTQQQLDDAREKSIIDEKKLGQITTALKEKIVQIEQLEAEKRRLREQNKLLEDQIAQLTEGGGVVVDRTPVTPLYGSVKRAPIIPGDVDLKGLITEVAQSLVTISLGSDDGVKENMVFHVVRGDEFLCNIVITNVDTNKAAGVLELVQQRPRVGDNVSTRL